MSLRVVFAGTPQFALPALAALAHKHQIVGVLTQPDRPAGRGRLLTASPVKQLAQSLQLEVAQPQSLRGDAAAAALELLNRWRPDVMVVVAYGLILPQAVLDLPRYGCLNIHASLLPRWRGAAPIQRAILAGDRSTGVTIMQMAAGLDTGAMLLQSALPIGVDTVSAGLHDELAALGARLILEALTALPANHLVARPQPEEGVTYAQKLSKAEALLDWSQPAVQIDRQIRAFNPWPVAHTLYQSQPLQLLASRLLPQRLAPADTVPGTVLGLDDGLLCVACGEGVVGVRELRRAGRGTVDAAVFANAEGIGRTPAATVFG
ncbi:MAG: methionyl-tRNA formyltransferase [Pseudomonadota bacterium]